MSDALEQFKALYKNGYRCIHSEKGTTNTYTLRNFDYGKFDTITTQNNMEVGEIDDFLDEVKAIRKKTGHDCICTGYETDQ